MDSVEQKQTYDTQDISHNNLSRFWFISEDRIDYEIQKLNLTI